MRTKIQIMVLALKVWVFILLMPFCQAGHNRPRATLNQWYQDLDKSLQPVNTTDVVWNDLRSFVSLGSFLLQKKDFTFHRKDLMNGRLREFRKNYLAIMRWNDALTSSLRSIFYLPATHWEPMASYMTWLDPHTPRWLSSTYTCEDMKYIKNNFPLFIGKVLLAKLTSNSARLYESNLLNLKNYFKDFEEYALQRLARKKGGKKGNLPKI